MRVVTQCVYIALFSFSLGTVVLFLLPMQMEHGLVKTCLESWELPFFAL